MTAIESSLNYFLLLNQSNDFVQLLRSKSDSGNLKQHPIGPAFSKNSTACTSGFSSPIRRSEGEKRLAARILVRAIFPALSKLQVIAGNSVRFIALLAPVVIALVGANNFYIGFSTVISKSLDLNPDITVARLTL